MMKESKGVVPVGTCLPLNKAKVLHRASDAAVASGKAVTVLTYLHGVKESQGVIDQIQAEVGARARARVPAAHAGHSSSLSRPAHAHLLTRTACRPLCAPRSRAARRHRAPRTRLQGCDIDLLELRSLKPLDMAAIKESLQRTHKVAILDESTYSGGVGATVSAAINEALFYDLDAPVKRLCMDDAPVPYAASMEAAVVKRGSDLVTAVLNLCFKLE
jgi:pyruvate/2-oxoglutarate/acetoin dehydrogenase E1 component